MPEAIELLFWVVVRRGGTVADRICALLRASPGMSLDAMTERVYGVVEDRTKHRLRSALHTLYKQGKIQKIGVGKWRVATDPYQKDGGG